MKMNICRKGSGVGVVVSLIALVLLSARSAFALSAYANGYVWAYELTSGDEMAINGARITGIYTDANCNTLAHPRGALSVPANLGGYSVVSLDLGDSSYGELDEVASIQLPPSLKEIGESALSGTSISSISLPAGLLRIGSYAFSGCEKLTSISIPASVYDLGYDGDALSDCPARITVSAGNPYYASDSQGFLYDKNRTSLLIIPTTATSVSVLSSVEYIGAGIIPAGAVSFAVEAGNRSYAIWSGCLYNQSKTVLVAVPRNATNLSICETVTSIGSGAIADCRNLTFVVVPYGVVSMGNSAFSGCSSLSSIDLPASLTTIGAGAFAGCSSLSVVDLPASLTTIGRSAFLRCSSLQAVCYRCEKEPSVPGAAGGVQTLYRNTPDSLVSYAAWCMSPTTWANRELRPWVPIETIVRPIAGSCEDEAIPFAFTPSVAVYPVTLTRKWLADEGRYDNARGVFFARASVARGKEYTIALPRGQNFEVSFCDPQIVKSRGACGTGSNNGVEIDYTDYGALRFCHIDVRGLVAEMTDIMLAISGALGTQATVYVVEGDYLARKIFFDANGGTCEESCKSVRTGKEAGWLPIPDVRPGYMFAGWYTARSGGNLLTAATIMGANDVTVYAHWQYATAGACEGGAQRFYIGNGVGTLAATLTSQWHVDDDGVGRYDFEEGVFYYKVSLKRGCVYTFAKPYDDFGLDIWGATEDLDYDLDYDTDGMLEYYIADTSEMGATAADFYVCLYGNPGTRATLYHAEGNYAPFGLSIRPEAVSGALNGKEWKVGVSRTLRNREYWFQVTAEPGIGYGFSVSGRKNISVTALTGRYSYQTCQPSSQFLPCDTNESGADSARISFHVDSSRVVWVRVTADEAGDFAVTAHWTKYDPEAIKWQLFDALGRPNGDVQTGGDAGWTVAAGAQSARSGAIDNNGTSWTELSFKGCGHLSFEWKVSSESGYDKLKFSVDGAFREELSGETGWRTVSADIDGEDLHVARWEYVKDVGASAGADCGWVRNVRWTCSTPHEISVRLYANGGNVYTSRISVMSGGRYGPLPEAWRTGYLFAGWHTARDGGLRMSGQDMVLEAVTTLYAHWEESVAGSCEEAAIGFTIPQSVNAYDVELTGEWTGERYDGGFGVRYYSTTLRRGGVYTMAVPRDMELYAWTEDVGCDIEYCEDDVLSYVRMDARNLVSGSAEVRICLSGGAAGKRTVLYAVAIDAVPQGSGCNPERLNVKHGNVVAAERLDRSLRAGRYSFRADCEAGARYAMYVSGRRQIEACAGGEASIIYESISDNAHFVCFSVPSSRTVDITVSAGETGQFSAQWSYVGARRSLKLVFDANGGNCDIREKAVSYWSPVGELPVPVRGADVFAGWHTAREGGAKVASDTLMSVTTDVVLYAHWVTIAAGSCEDAAIPFAFTQSVDVYPVTLTREWFGDRMEYSGGDGVLYCKTTLKRGRVYTMAVPRGTEAHAWCDDDRASVTCGEDESLRYVRFDTRYMTAAETEAFFVATGTSGMRTTIYAVESDFKALGSCEDRAIQVVPGYAVGVASADLRPEWTEDGFVEDGPVCNFEITLNRGDVCTLAFPELLGWWELHSDRPDVENDIFQYVWDGELCYVLADLRNVDLRAPGSGNRHLPLRIQIRFSGRRGERAAFYHCLGNLLPKPLHRVIFNGNGGTPEYGEKDARYGNNVGALPNAERAGYSFDGWYTAPEGGARVYESTVMVDFDVTLYAHWTPRRYKVTFMSQGSVIAIRTVTFMSPLGELPVPPAPWDGMYQMYRPFNGWFYGNCKVSAETPMSVPSDITLTASWMVPVGI